MIYLANTGATFKVNLEGCQKLSLIPLINSLFKWLSVQSSFLVIHKVDNICSFVQLLMRINWKWLLVESILMQIYICYVPLNYNLIFKVKTIQKPPKL